MEYDILHKKLIIKITDIVQMNINILLIYLLSHKGFFLLIHFK